MLDFTHNRGVPARSRINLSYDAVVPLLAVTDALVVIIASVVGGGGYHFAISGSLGDVQLLLGLGFIGSLSYSFGARQLGLYDRPSLLQPRHEYLRIALGILFLMFILTTTLFLLKLGERFSRGSVICFFLLVACLLPIARRFSIDRLRRALRSGAILGRRAILLGTSAELSSLSPDEMLTQFGIVEIKRIILPYRTAVQSATASELAALQMVVDASRDLRADELLLCMSWENAHQLRLAREKLRIVPLPVRLLPDRSVRSIWNLQQTMDRPPVIVDIQRAPLSSFEQLVKRVLDLFVASLLLILLSPLMFLTAAAVRLESRGPVIFRQRRNGFNGREFQICKFRTMHVVEDGSVIAQATRDDHRVTRLGRILRRTSVDELPQLFNVLKGDMSIVGPRPHALAHDGEYEELIARYAFRHHVKPGMTGWAQVNGLRGETSALEQMRKRVEFDLWYIDNWSIGLDLKILARTSVEVARGYNAY